MARRPLLPFPSRSLAFVAFACVCLAASAQPTDNENPNPRDNQEQPFDYSVYQLLDPLNNQGIGPHLPLSNPDEGPAEVPRVAYRSTYPFSKCPEGVPRRLSAPFSHPVAPTLSLSLLSLLTFTSFPLFCPPTPRLPASRLYEVQRHLPQGALSF